MPHPPPGRSVGMKDQSGVTCVHGGVDMRTKCTGRRKIPATILSLSVAAATALVAGLALHAAPALADETCNSPYVNKI